MQNIFFFTLENAGHAVEYRGQRGFLADMQLECTGLASVPRVEQRAQGRMCFQSAQKFANAHMQVLPHGRRQTNVGQGAQGFAHGEQRLLNFLTL